VTVERRLRLGIGGDDIGAPLKDYIAAQLVGDPRLESLRDFNADDLDPRARTRWWRYASARR